MNYLDGNKMWKNHNQKLKWKIASGRQTELTEFGFVEKYH